MNTIRKKTTPAAAVATLLALADAAVAAFMRAEDAGESADAPARLLAYAEGHLHTLVREIKEGPLTTASACAWLNDLAEIQSFTEGAIALDKRRNKDRTPQSRTALEALEAMVHTLDKVPGWWPEESNDEYCERRFIAGKALACDMLEEAISYSPHDVAELLATYRRRGVAQNEFASKYLEQVQTGTSFGDGFCAVLAGTLSAAGESGLDPKETREASYADCVGGPDTKYVSEGQEPERAPRSAVGVVIDRVDCYIEATEHACGSEGGEVFECIHSEVWGPLVKCREAKERGHDEAAARLLPKLRAGIAKAFAHCDVNDGRWPLLKVSLGLVDEFLAAPAQPPKATGLPLISEGRVSRKEKLASALG